MTTRIRSVSMKCDVPGCPGESPAYATHAEMNAATTKDGWTHLHLYDYCPEVEVHDALHEQMSAELRAAYPELVRNQTSPGSES